MNDEVIYPSEEEGDNFTYLLPVASPGTLNLTAQTYVQDKRKAKSFMRALRTLRAEKSQIEARLQDGVDPITRQQLENRLAWVNDEIGRIRDELSKLRAAIGAPESVVIYGQ